MKYIINGSLAPISSMKREGRHFFVVSENATRRVFIRGEGFPHLFN